MEPWRAKLAAGDANGAWTLFLDRYRRLILATIRRIVTDQEAVVEVFGYVCAALSERELARLQRYRDGAPGQASFPAWLVTVIHNQVIDWLRQRDGRSRVSIPATLSGIRRSIFVRVFVEQRTHAEAYELVRSSTVSDLTFRSFLQELVETYRLVERTHPRGVMRYLAAPPPLPVATEPVGDGRLTSAEVRQRLAEALESLVPEDRLALQLYVVEGLPAGDVALTLGWPNSKAVYNRVYRGLTRLRAFLQRDGIEPTDF